jgi:hypothetical protein
MKGNIQTDYPLLTLLLKGMLEEVKSGVLPDDLRKAIIDKSISFAIAQKDNTYITIKATGINSFKSFLQETGITVNGGVRKVSKYLRRAFMQCKGGCAYTGNINGRHVTKDELSRNYSGNKDDLFACLDGTIFADPKFLTKIWGCMVRENDTFLGTVILNGGKFSKGKITAKSINCDVIVYDVKKAISFHPSLNYIHLMYKLEEPPIALKPSECVGWRNPNGSRLEKWSFNLARSHIDKPRTSLYYSRLDLQSVINFRLFKFMPDMAVKFLGNILDSLNSNSIRELLGGYSLDEDEDKCVDKWLLKDVLDHTQLEIAEIPGLMRKTKVFFGELVRKMQIDQLASDGVTSEKWQLPTLDFIRLYITSDPTAFDADGIWHGNGSLRKGEAEQHGANLFFSVEDPADAANILKVLGGADCDGDSLLITNNVAIIEHIKALPAFSKEKMAYKQASNNCFANYGHKSMQSYDEQAFLSMTSTEETFLLGGVINRCMLLTDQYAHDNDLSSEALLAPIVNSTERIIDHAIGASDEPIDDILIKLELLMSKVSTVPSYLANRFLDRDSKEPKYQVVETVSSQYFTELNRLVENFYRRLNQLQANPKLPFTMVDPVSNEINQLSIKLISRYNRRIKEVVKDNLDMEEGYANAVNEVKAVYSSLQSDKRLELTTALMLNVYYKETSKATKEGERGFPDGVVYSTWMSSHGRPNGPGVAFSYLAKQSGLGHVVRKAHINYDAIIPNHSYFEVNDGCKVVYNGKVVGTTTAKGECSFIKDGKRDLMLEHIAKRQLFSPSSDLIPVYLYKLKGCGLTKRDFLSLKSIEIAQCDSLSFAFVNGIRLNIASKIQDLVIPVGRYSVLLSEVADSKKSVHLLLQAQALPVALAN